MQRLRKIGLGCLGLLLASGLCLWLAADRVTRHRVATDLPRRALAAVLSDRLAARVHVDRLEILGRKRFLLAGLSMTGFRDYPFIESLRLEQLEIEGSLAGMLDNRFDRLRLRGLDVRLAPAPAPELPDRPLPQIGELILEPASIRLAGGEPTEQGAGGEPTEYGVIGSGHDDLLLCLEATVRDLPAPGAAPEAATLETPPGRKTGPKVSGFGTVRLSAAELDLRSLYALVSAAPPVEARFSDLVAELAFDAGGVRLRARAESSSLANGGGRLVLEQPRLSADRSADRFGPVTSIHAGAASATAEIDGRLATAAQPSAEATVTTTPGGVQHVELVPHLPWLADGRLAADWHPAGERFLGFEARLRGLDVKPLLPDLGLEATAAAWLRAGGDRLDYRLEMTPAELAMGDNLELTGIGGSTVRVTGSLPFESLAALKALVRDGPPAGEPLAGEPLAAMIEIPAGDGRWGALTLPPAAFPLAASFDGRWLGASCCAGARRPRGHSFSGDYRLASPAAGRLSAGGEVAVQDGDASADLSWAWTGIDLEPLIQLLRRTGLALPAFDLTGTGEARGRLRGPIGGASAIRGTFHLQGLEAAAETGAGIFRLRGGESTASLHRAAGQGAIEVQRMETSGTLTAPGIEPLILALHASGQFASNLAHGRLEGTLRESPGGTEGGLGTAHVSGDWRRSTGLPPEISGRVSLEGLDLARWQRVARPLAAAEALAGFQLAGSAGADLEGAVNGGTWNLAGPVRLESAGFTSLDGSRVAEGLDSRFDVNLHGAASAPIEAAGSGRLGGFLLLWNTFFGDFSQIEASLAARARIEPAGGGPRRWRLEVESALPEGPIAEATLEHRGDGWRYTLSLDDADLAATHQRYLAALLEQQLGRLELGGKLAARVYGNYRAGEPPAWSVIGGLQVQGLHASSGGGQAAVAGLDLDLPLHLRRSPSPGDRLELSGPRLAGRLAFKRLAVRGLELPPTATDLSVEADSVGLEKPLVLPVLGGEVTLERLTLRQLLRPSRHLESGIALSGIRLERISDELELLPLEGALNGSLSGVRLSPSQLSVDGGGVIEAFGGTVEVRDISGQDVLSRFPKLRLSADFRDLDLGALTRRIDFGEMTGILEGTLEDLELFRGVPVRFFARLETTHREGMPRTVDVKAVNNITILGTGQRAGVLDRGIQKFFDRYTYQRLGVTMRLDRDVLLLRGLERRGDKELFLRGRLPFRIDVVNAQPGKTVSFQTMVGRLKSLDFARATTEPQNE